MEIRNGNSIHGTPDLFAMIDQKSDQVYLFWYMSYEEAQRFTDLCIAVNFL